MIASKVIKQQEMITNGNGKTLIYGKMPHNDRLETFAKGDLYFPL